MKPGYELDKLVAEAMGYSDFWQDRQTGQWYGMHPDRTNLEDDRIPVPQFSVDGYAAWEAFEWLEQNHPWDSKILLSLCRGGVDKKLSTVRISQKGEWGEITAYREIVGESYSHAICLAVLLAKVEKGF